jgi:hypothetical protein
MSRIGFFRIGVLFIILVVIVILFLLSKNIKHFILSPSISVRGIVFLSSFGASVFVFLLSLGFIGYWHHTSGMDTILSVYYKSLIISGVAWFFVFITLAIVIML